jgi:hypothetical protein
MPKNAIRHHEGILVYDSVSFLKLIDFCGKMIHDFGRVHMDSHAGSQQMLVSRDGSFLWAGSIDGILTQFSLRGRGMVRDFGTVATVLLRICD